MDPNIQVHFDGKTGMSFVQGEDRTYGLTFENAVDGQPVSLATATGLTVNLPQAGGGTIRRTTVPLSLTGSAVSLVAPGSIKGLSHGLVTGDPLIFTGGPPAPLSAAGGEGIGLPTTYYAKGIDQATFSVTDVTGHAITLTSIGLGAFGVNLAVGDLVVSSDTSGTATLSLRAAVTSVVNPAQAQGFQVVVSLSGKTRIVLLPGYLDCYRQLDP